MRLVVMRVQQRRDHGDDADHEQQGAGGPLAQGNGTLHRSFQGYTTHASRELISVGVSAIGQVGDLYTQNRKSLPEYATARSMLPRPSAGSALNLTHIFTRSCNGRACCRRTAWSNSHRAASASRRADAC